MLLSGNLQNLGDENLVLVLRTPFLFSDAVCGRVVGNTNGRPRRLVVEWKTISRKLTNSVTRIIRFRIMISAAGVVLFVLDLGWLGRSWYSMIDSSVNQGSRGELLLCECCCFSFYTLHNGKQYIRKSLVPPYDRLSNRLFQFFIDSRSIIVGPDWKPEALTMLSYVCTLCNRYGSSCIVVRQ